MYLIAAVSYERPAQVGLIDDQRALPGKVCVAAAVVWVRVRVDHKADGPIRDSSDQGQDPVVENGVVRVDDENAIIARHDGHIPTCAGDHVNLAGNVAENHFDRRHGFGVVNLVVESAYVGNRASSLNRFLRKSPPAENHNAHRPRHHICHSSLHRSHLCV